MGPGFGYPAVECSLTNFLEITFFSCKKSFGAHNKKYGEQVMHCMRMDNIESGSMVI